MSDEGTARGPDLAKGVPSVTLDEGKMLAGHVGADAVMIARVSGKLYAIGAECTHYHGPLAEGLLKNGAVRCPWHHACFSLTTGEAVGAPAFDPVACYVVEETDGKITVGTKLAPKSETSPSPIGVNRVVIVGGGAGGFAAAEMLRRLGYIGDLTVFSADRDAPYDRPNCSKDFLSGDAPAEWMPLRDAAFYKENKIDLRLKTTVASFDTQAKTVILESGESHAYDVLILATGAEPQRPPIPGLDGDKTVLLRSLEDAEALSNAAGTAKIVAVVGASFIGLEAAAALVKRGLKVHVIAPEDVPFEKLLGATVGRWVKDLHESKGVDFHLGAKVQNHADGALHLDTGDRVEADVVVLGVGVRPRTGLAEAAGLTVDKGVVVDDRLRAAANVYALGDIARYPDHISGELIRVEHWVHAQRQGQHVARTIMGEDKPYTDVPFFWSAHYDAAIHYDGHVEAFDRSEIEGSVAAYDATISYEKSGRRLAVATLNRDLASLEAEAAMEPDDG